MENKITNRINFSKDGPALFFDDSMNIKLLFSMAIRYIRPDATSDFLMSVILLTANNTSTSFWGLFTTKTNTTVTRSHGGKKRQILRIR